MEYIDIQNVYNAKIEQPDYFTVKKDVNGQPIVNVESPGSYEWKLIKNVSGTVLPSIGVMFEF